MHEHHYKVSNIIIGSIAALSGLVALFGYLEHRDNKDLKTSLLRLDHEIKLLELEKKKAEIVQVYS